MATIILALLKSNATTLQRDHLQRTSNPSNADSPDGNGLHMHYFQQIEDPTEFYVISHMHPSSATENEDHLLEKTKTALEQSRKHPFEILWIRHLRIEYTTLPTQAPVMAIGRHFIRADSASQFDATYQDVKHLVEGFPANRGLAGGWCIDADDDAGSEWVQFSGWDEVAEHRMFPRSEGFVEYSRIREFVERIEVRHCVRVND